MSLNIRKATIKDSVLIYDFICELAEFERMSDAVKSTPESIIKTIFSDKPAAEVIIAEWRGVPAGFALYFYNYSTFLGKRGVYLEDLFVRNEFRKLGIGKALLSEVANIAVTNDCGRFEWSVLDWNPAREFYEYLGAAPLKGWHVYRIDGDNLKKLAGKI